MLGGRRILSRYVSRQAERKSLASFGLRHSSNYKHETWRDEAETDNVPKVKRRDGSFGPVEKTRGFINYNRNPEP